MTEDAIRNRNRQAAGASAVMGGTEESLAATKAANAQAMGDAASSLGILIMHSKVFTDYQKLELVERIGKTHTVTVCDFEPEYLHFWKKQWNPNPDDCCNLRAVN